MMKFRLYLMSFASAIAAVGWTPSAAAQQRPIPATSAPRELAMLADVPTPSGPVASPSLDAILKAAHLTRADVERRKSAARVSKPIPAVPHAPPEFQAVETRGMQPAAAAASPTVRELIEIIRRRRGGSQLLERARRGGAQIISPLSTNSYESFSGTEHPAGPWSSTDASEGDLITTAQDPPSIKVTRSAPLATLTGLGSLWAQAYFPIYATADLTKWGPLDRYSYAHSPVGGTYTAKSYVLIRVTAEITGWYLINVLANNRVRAEMRQYSGSFSSGYPIIEAFTAPPTTGYNSYPVLVNLAAGSHYFSWVNLDRMPFVSEVSVYKF